MTATWESEWHPPVSGVDPEDIEATPRPPTFVGRMRAAFLAEIEKGGAVSSTPTSSVPTFTDWVSTELRTPPVVGVPLYTRSQEEAMMRPHKSGERQCSKGDCCEGVLMRRYTVGVDGFLLPAMPASDLCILCMRVQTSMHYYRALLTNNASGVRQTHRNIVGVVGELSGCGGCPSVLNCGYYLPMVLCVQTKNCGFSPVVHVLYKALPQRCQFRNFSNIALEYMREVDGCMEWMVGILAWTLTGTMYQWWAGADGLRIRRAAPLMTVDWERFFVENIRLFFFVVKEFFVYLVSQQPGLAHALEGVHRWREYAAEIKKTMNQVRQIAQACTASPWKEIAAVINKFIPRQLKCIKPVPRADFGGVWLSVWSKFDYDEMRTAGAAVVRDMYTIEMVGIVHERLYKKVVNTREWWVLVGGSTKSACDVVATFPPRIRSDILKVLVAKKIQSEFIITPLAESHYRLQVNAVRVRNRLGTAAADGELNRRCEYYFCPACETFKGFAPTNKELAVGVSRSAAAYGHSGISYDFSTGRVFCSSTSSRKKRRILHCETTPCVRVPLLGRMASVFGTTWVLCTRCAMPCRFGVNARYTGALECGTCRPASEDKQVCSYCARCTKVRAWYCYNDCEPPHKIIKIYLCNIHSRANWHTERLLLKSDVWGAAAAF